MSDPILTTHGLTRRFDGVVAVAEVAFSAEAGTVHGLIGPNGAGKTTVLNMVSGHLRPTSGSITLRGAEIGQLPPEARAKVGIRRTFQNLRLFREMTALDNVRVGLHANAKSEIFQSLLRTPAQRREEAEIVRRSWSALAFMGLERVADTPAGSLPYGHQRLLEIARAIVADPSVLLLDEPAAGLNRTEAAQMVGHIRRIQERGTTIILVEHHMDVVMRTCSMITVLNYGRKLAEGTPSQIRADPEVVNAYLGREHISDRTPDRRAGGGHAAA